MKTRPALAAGNSTPAPASTLVARQGDHRRDLEAGPQHLGDGVSEHRRLRVIADADADGPSQVSGGLAHSAYGAPCAVQLSTHEQRMSSTTPRGSPSRAQATEWKANSHSHWCGYVAGFGTAVLDVRPPVRLQDGQGSLLQRGGHTSIIVRLTDQAACRIR